MSSDRPSEYVRKLENEIRCLRADRERLASERDRAQLRALESEAFARAMTSSSTSAAFTAERALARALELESIVNELIAAWDVDFADIDGYQRLDSLIEAERLRRESRS